MAEATSTLSELISDSSSATLLQDATSTAAAAVLDSSSTTAATLDPSAASSASLSSLLSSASSVLADASSASSSAASLIASATGGAVEKATHHPASYRIVGIILAVVSGLFIGSSFVFKKKGLLSMQSKPGFVAGEGHAYLKSPMWWTGMILMIVGELANTVAYAFTDAILVTPLGAISVVVCAILSSIFLKEKLSFFGKVGCFLCILGATIVALNGPTQSAAATIPEFQRRFLSPGFLAYGSVVIVVSLGLIFFVAPKYGKKNMLVYILVCSLIGGLSVVSISGLGGSILTSINGNNQFKHWFIYFLIAFVAVTLITEINYLNKALELFNTALVTPTYYCIFCFATLVTDAVLFGFDVPVVDIITVVFGFLVICCGIVLLQISKIDPAELAQQVKLDRKATTLLSAVNKVEHVNENRFDGEQDDLDQNGELDLDSEKMRRRNLDLEDPGIDSVRGFVGLAGSIHRAVSARRSIQSRRRKASLLGGGRRPSGVDETGNLVYKDGRWTSRRPFDGLTTSGAQHDGLVRHQLYDAPMPPDAADRISQFTHSDNGLPSPSSATAPRNRLRSPTIGFEEEVIEHRYPRHGEKGDIVHQQHYPPPYLTAGQDSGNGGLRPSASNVSSASTRGAGRPSANSIIDAYGPDGIPTPTTPTAPSFSDPSSSSSVATTTIRPPPAMRQQHQNFSTFPVRSISSSSSDGGSGAGGVNNGTTSTATVQRGNNRSLTSMLTEHFASSTPDLSLDMSRLNAGLDGDRPNASGGPAKARSPTSNFFASVGRGISGHRTREGKTDDAELDRQERLGLVGQTADYDDNEFESTPRESVDSEATSRRLGYADGDSEDEEGEEEDHRHDKPRHRRYRDDDGDADDGMPMRRL